MTSPLPGRLDSQGMFALAAATPEQVVSAARAARAAATEIEAFEPANVVIAGVGAAALAGDIVASVTSAMAHAPVSVVRSYECPAYVGPGSLVLALSSSGLSEETLQVATDAEAAGAAIVAVTGGGRLASLAQSWGAPVVPATAGITVPRAALAAMAVASLTVLEHLGLYRGGQAWIAAAADQLKRRRDEVEAAGDTSLPAVVARRIGRTLPVVHGGGLLGAAAARRWKAQVNENAKTPAWWAAQPDLCHDEVCGWGQHGDVTRQVLTLVTLRHEGEHPQVGRRLEAVAEMMREVVADVLTVEAAGEGDLAQLLDLVLVGDYTSLWMAAGAGVDPGPVPALADLDEVLAGD